MQGFTLENYTKATFHDKEIQAKAMLERFHLDVCGPFSTTSIEKHRYYEIFVDDYSCKCCILFMQNKYYKFSKFCEFKMLVEKDTWNKVKAMRSDNGGEYISNEFRNFYASKGIRREFIVLGSRDLADW